MKTQCTMALVVVVAAFFVTSLVVTALVVAAEVVPLPLSHCHPTSIPPPSHFQPTSIPLLVALVVAAGKIVAALVVAVALVVAAAEVVAAALVAVALFVAAALIVTEAEVVVAAAEEKAVYEGMISFFLLFSTIFCSIEHAAAASLSFSFLR
jgi:hypothetical protein